MVPQAHDSGRALGYVRARFSTIISVSFELSLEQVSDEHYALIIKVIKKITFKLSIKIFGGWT
jgi:hypothetical protein